MNGHALKPSWANNMWNIIDFHSCDKPGSGSNDNINNLRSLWTQCDLMVIG
jgi:hypothetical protein